ncbi:MAG: hypothetical protein EOM20_07460 [Spartobacteria bacterium]|nr:hypothetical protein [Spartobacteria bacterium]
MTKKEAIQVFEQRSIRSLWDDEAETWYFSIVDVIAALTDSPNPQVYWRVLKKRLKDEGNQTVTNCNALKMRAADGKMRSTDCANTEQLFRLIQSVPSPKAEPFKLWMAQVASERIDQIQDPELSIEQAMRDYKRLGYSDNWINQRLKSIEIRKELTDEWKKHGLEEGVQFAALTDIIYKTWADKTAKEISEVTDPDTFQQHKQVARQGGEVARNARLELEAKTGKKVISPLNAKDGILLEGGGND